MGKKHIVTKHSCYFRYHYSIGLVRLRAKLNRIDQEKFRKTGHKCKLYPKRRKKNAKTFVYLMHQNIMDDFFFTRDSNWLMDMIAVEAFMSLTSFKVNDYLCNMNFLEWHFSFNFFLLWQNLFGKFNESIVEKIWLVWFIVSHVKKEESNKNSNDFRSQIICK